MLPPASQISPTSLSAARPPGRRIHDDDLVAALSAAAADERRGGRVLWRDGHDMRCSRSATPSRCRTTGTAQSDLPGDQQGGLGHPVYRVERLRPETGRAEGIGEPLQGGGPHRLRTTHGRRPGGQIERRAFLRTAAFDAELVGKVRRGGDRAAVPGNRFQPAHWALNKRLRRHKEGGAADVKSFEDTADETHVVMERQPEHADRVVVSASPRLTDGIQVVQQVTVRHHNALRRTR